MNGKYDPPEHWATEVVLTIVSGKVTSARVLRNDEFIASFGTMAWMLEKAGYSVGLPPEEQERNEPTGIQGNEYA
ncbi:hypothetical protein ACNDF6_004398 [Escherichia coli]